MNNELPDRSVQAPAFERSAAEETYNRVSSGMNLIAVALIAGALFGALLTLMAFGVASKPTQHEAEWRRAGELAGAYDNGFTDGWHSLVAHYPLATNRMEISPLVEDMLSGASNYVYKSTR